MIKNYHIFDDVISTEEQKKISLFVQEKILEKHLEYEKD